MRAFVHGQSLHWANLGTACPRFAGELTTLGGRIESTSESQMKSALVILSLVR